MMIHIPAWIVYGYIIVGCVAILAVAAYTVAYLAWEAGRLVVFCAEVWREAFIATAKRKSRT